MPKKGPESNGLAENTRINKPLGAISHSSYMTTLGQDGVADPLPAPPTLQALDGFRQLLALCRAHGVNYLGFACVHASARQEVGLLEPDFAQVMAESGVRDFALEQDKDFGDAIVSLYERQEKYNASDQDLEAHLTEMVVRNFRTEYTDVRKGASIASGLAFGAWMAKALMSARTLGIQIHGVDRAQMQMVRAGYYFASADPHAPPATAREMQDFLLSLNSHSDVRQLRDLTGFRSDQESAVQVAQQIDLRRKGGEAEPLMLGTHGAFHLSMPPSLDTLLPPLGVKSAKIIMAADVDEMDVLRGSYNTDSDMEDLPPTIFCMQDGQWYDRASGQLVAPSADLLCIQTPPADAAPPPPRPEPARARIMPAQDDAPDQPVRAAPLRARPLSPAPSPPGEKKS